MNDELTEKFEAFNELTTSLFDMQHLLEVCEVLELLFKEDSKILSALEDIKNSLESEN